MRPVFNRQFLSAVILTLCGGGVCVAKNCCPFTARMFYSFSRRSLLQTVTRRRQRPHMSLSTMASYVPLKINGQRCDERNTETAKERRRLYHATPQREMVLYGTIIVVVSLSYVAYRKYNGEPIKPHGATNAQTAYQKYEQDRLDRNKQYEKNE